MKEHPILFSSAMVRAICEGHKTQTRRVIKEQPKRLDATAWMWSNGRTAYATETAHSEIGLLNRMLKHCPYGQPGDRLWVRETWATLKEYDGLKPSAVPIYDRPPVVYYRADTGAYLLSKDRGKWRPSIFMPRWASQLTLEVVEVRVEQIQDISVQDAIEEGIELDGLHDYPACDFSDGVLVRFADLWDSINSKRGYGWDANPSVWVVEFEVTDA